MESLFLFLIFFLVAGPLLALIALIRTGAIRELKKKVSDLEDKVFDLERKLRSVERRPAAPEPAPAPPPAPSPPPERVAPPPPAAPAPQAPAAPPVEAKPPSPPKPPPRPPAFEPPAPPTIDWERWIGIRGAALLGAIVLALAGLLFFQYSIQHGLITPAMRVILGIVVGIGCLAASEWLRPRGIRATPEGLAGAGVVILYAAFWAAHALYAFIPLTITFVLMALVTAVCGLLAVRHASKVVAVLGLIGGFATPLLLHAETDRPFGLFGYVLLLDLGLLAIGHRKRWPWLGLLALGGTVLIQGTWIGFQMRPDRVLLGLAILTLFAVVFAASGLFAKGEDRAISRLGSAGGLLLPFAFAVYFASRIDLGPHLRPMAIFLAVLSLGAAWVARREKTPWLGLAAAAAAVGVFAVWRTNAAATEGAAWESAVIALGLAAVFHLFVELDREPPGLDGPAPAAMLAAGGTFAVLLFASTGASAVPPWPWLAGWLGLSALLYRHAAFPDREPLQIAAAFGTALGIALQHLLHARAAEFPGPARILGAAAAVAITAQVVAFFRREGAPRAMANHAAAAFAGITAFALSTSPILGGLGPGIALGGSLVFGVLVLLAGTRLSAGGWALAGLGVTVLVHAIWIAGRTDLAESSDLAQQALGLILLGVAVFNFWPFLAGRALRADRFAWYAAALAGPLWFFPARKAWIDAFGDGAIGLLPILLGAIALAAVAGAGRKRIEDDAARLTARVWLSAVAISFASVAIPLQLEKSWITIGWALEGIALLALWKRLDHPGLKWLALAHLAAVTVRLFPTEALLGYYPRSSTPILNWVLYTYLVPAAALFTSARLLAPDEAGRARGWEKDVYAQGKPIGAIAAAVAGIFVVFVWLNLAIADWFAEGPQLTLEFGRSPARDLTVSIAWAVYALVLLGIGMARASSPLRWLSLAFLVVTIGKVFLYDLGELQDLYRVVSLVGLAVSLISVSLLYQRFVFRKKAEESP